MKIQNPFRLGLLAGLGVLVAIVIGGAVASLATILTYIGAALFLALGLDPLITWLEKHRVKRPIAILIALVGVIGVFVGLVFALIPVIAEQVNNLITLLNDEWIPAFKNGSVAQWIEQTLPWLSIDDLIKQATGFLTDKNFLGGVLQVGVAIAGGVFGVIIVIILVIYFTASLGSLKRGIYQFVPATKRPQFVDLAEQISESVGRYVIGQVTLALCNGVLSFLFLTFVCQVKYAALLAFIAFLGSLIPLVGTLSASVIIVLGTLLFNGFDAWWLIPFPVVFLVAGWYLIYMQVESYVLNPRIMARAVKVPGVVVVIAALVGGTLLGILGALIAIPVAAAVQLIIREVIVPRQNEL